MSLHADLRPHGRSPDQFETHPLVKDRLTRPRTVFYPGSRMKMNVLPMIINLFVPWGVFTFVAGICSSWMMYNNPGVAWTFVMIVYVGWLVGLRGALAARRYDAQPTWFSYVAVTVGIAAVAGTMCGLANFAAYRKPFFQIRDLKIVKNLDASREYGQNWMDAGILEFKRGIRLDGLKSWHFKHGTLYCVAPIVMNESVPETQSYDFWAVGKDCCSVGSSDFRCGDWSQSEARKGIRIIDDEAAPLYHLAVRQAETLYGIVAAHPIFVRWAADPEEEVAQWNRKAFSSFVFMVCVAFVVSLFLLVMATCNFAFLGRGSRMERYDDPDWNTDIYKPMPVDQPMDGAIDPQMGMFGDPRMGTAMGAGMQSYHGV